MPIYEYRCQTCNHELEALQKISDPVLVECPSCGASELKKRVSAAAFRLNGGGCYETYFKTGEKNNIAGEKNASDSSGKDSSGAAAPSTAAKTGTASSDGGSSGKSTATS
jgi:putative FmdB family regulatory protein